MIEGLWSGFWAFANNHPWIAFGMVYAVAWGMSESVKAWAKVLKFERTVTILKTDLKTEEPPPPPAPKSLWERLSEDDDQKPKS